MASRAYIAAGFTPMCVPLQNCLDILHGEKAKDRNNSWYWLAGGILNEPDVQWAHWNVLGILGGGGGIVEEELPVLHENWRRTRSALQIRSSKKRTTCRRF